jgi:GH35 family endo-1,4-beta-xylanase
MKMIRMMLIRKTENILSSIILIIRIIAPRLCSLQSSDRLHDERCPMRNIIVPSLLLCLLSALWPAALAAQPAPAANDLRAWIDDYVHAYGETVIVNGEKMDAARLLAAVTANPAGFIEKKTIKGSEALFLVVNGAPLGIKADGAWRAVLARDLADAKNAQFAMPVVWHQTWNENFAKVIKNANMLTISHDLNDPVVFEKMTTDDWKKILRHWETIKTQLDARQIPAGLPYNWTDMDQWSGMNRIITFARENRMGLRAQHLVWNGDGLPDSIYKGGFTKAELLKILEFTISVKLIKYQDVISEWNAADELVLSEGSSDKWGFWQREVGLLDATRLAAGLVRKYDPDAKISIADDHETEERFYDRQPELANRLINLVKTLKREGLVDLVDIENNLWIYDLPTAEYMTNFLRRLRAEGVAPAAPEIMVFPTKAFPFWFGTRIEHDKVDDPLKAQAEGYRRAVQAYIDAGAYDIGLGDVADQTSAPNYLQPGSSTAPFDANWKPRMSWYEIMKVMYAGFLK